MDREGYAKSCGEGGQEEVKKQVDRIKCEFEVRYHLDTMIPQNPVHELDELFAEKYDDKTPAVDLEKFFKLERQKKERKAIT